MLKYEQLKNIALSNSDTSIFELAKEKGVDIRNKEQCKKDWKGGETPLTNNKAILAEKANRPIIYYDDTCLEYEFYIAHEIAHHLLKHCKDEFAEESEANMLACILIAPVEKLIRKNTISAQEISNTFLIPILQAKEYYKLLLDNDFTYAQLINTAEEILEKNEFKKVISKNPFARNVFLSLIALAAISVFSTLYMFNRTSEAEEQATIPDLSSPKEVEVEPSTLPPVSSVEPTQEDTTVSDSNALDNSIANNLVYVTTSGKKYHLKKCRYIKNKTNIKELSIDDALTLEYQPCSVCIQ